jgi:hypothetical protein
MRGPRMLPTTLYAICTAKDNAKGVHLVVYRTLRFCIARIRAEFRESNRTGAVEI